MIQGRLTWYETTHRLKRKNERALILFRQSGLFVSDHAVAPILGHLSVVSGALAVWIPTIVSTVPKGQVHQGPGWRTDQQIRNPNHRQGPRGYHGS